MTLGRNICLSVLVAAALVLLPVAGRTAEENVHSFTAVSIDGKEVPLSDYAGKTLLIVNTASRCGFTRQYHSLEAIYRRYKDEGLEVLAFPANNFRNQEPGTNEQIKAFCKFSFRITFPLFAKISVKGEDIHSLYDYLVNRSAFPGPIRWNFDKFLVNPEGRVIGRFLPHVDPMDPEILTEIQRNLPGPSGATAKKDN